MKLNTNQEDRRRGGDDEKQPSVSKDLKDISTRPSSFFENIYVGVLSLLSRIFV